MTREEKIHNAAVEVSNRWKRSELLPTQDEIIAYDAAVTMAEWADQHPRKGLWDSEKVCKFLYEKVMDITYLNEDNTNEHYDKDEFIEDLRKAMEDKQ